MLSRTNKLCTKIELRAHNINSVQFPSDPIKRLKDDELAMRDFGEYLIGSW